MNSSAILRCTRCHAALDDSCLNRGDLMPCPNCGTGLQVEAFPAFFRPIPRGTDGQPIMVEGEAGCFYHPQKKAAVECHACGRFLCALCDCELNGQHFCPACLEAGKQKGKIKNLENQRTLYGNIALALAIYPLILVFTIYFTFITAPIALFVALRYWNSPRSIVGGGRIRYVLALIVATLELGGWAAMIYFIATEGRQSG